jgi:hypothetical protein
MAKPDTPNFSLPARIMMGVLVVFVLLMILRVWLGIRL